MKILVRRALPTDLPFVLDIALLCFSYGVPRHRNVEDRDCRVRNAIEELFSIYGKDEDLEIIVAQDQDSDAVIGYIILQLDTINSLTEEREAFIQDMAINPRYWGKYVAQKLLAYASELGREKGMKYLVAIVSRDNERAFGTAIKALGFTPERLQVVKHL